MRQWRSCALPPRRWRSTCRAIPRASHAPAEAYEKDGAVCFRSCIEPNFIDLVARAVSENRENPGIGFEYLVAEGGEGGFWNDYCNWRQIKGFHEFLRNSGIASIARSLLPGGNAHFYHEHVLVKEKGSLKETPWHQDQPYYPFDGPLLSLWMPLDSVSKETTLKFVKGSHMWGEFIPRKFETEMEYTPIRPVCESYQHIPRDISSQSTKYEIISWAAEPGDIIAFNGRTIHGAKGNSGEGPRRVVSWRFLGDDAILVERPWDISPPTTGDLEWGQRLGETSSRHFPRLHSAGYL
ncbi:hypothetical protein AAMO2058_000711800 [Amorphochlora amoebiformis]